MVLDTSAIVAILLDEAENVVFSRILAGETEVVISPITLYEASLVMAAKKRTPTAAQLVDKLIRELGVEVPASTTDDALLARDAYFRYGKGYHAAGLNFADCVVYALSKKRDEPLLFKGDDFSKTDVVPAWRPAE